MPFFDSKIFNGEVFGKYVDTIPMLKRNELLKSRAVVRNDRYKDMMKEQTGGYFITVPIVGRIGGEPVNYDGKTDILSTGIDTYSHSRVVVGRAKAWTEKDFSYDITGGKDFMDEVGKQVAGYWDSINQDLLLAILEGIFAMTGTENKKFVDNHTNDLSGDVEGVFKETTLNNSLQKAVGENKANFTLAIMHSQVATNLENLQLLEYLKYTDSQGVQRNLAMGTINGRTVVIDDSMPVEEVKGTADDHTKYTTYALGVGAFEFTDAGAKVPYEMDRDPKVNGGEDTLYSRQRLCYSPFGISFTRKSMASLSPTNEELKNGQNWELVNNGQSAKSYIDHKTIPIARIITRGVILMDYLTHEKYIEMGGDSSLPVSDFKRLQSEMGTKLDYFTFGGIDYSSGKYTDRVERCIFEMITEALKEIWKRDSDGANISSETTSKYSVSYKTIDVDMIDKFMASKELVLYRIVKMHFSLSGLMYRGV